MILVPVAPPERPTIPLQDISASQDKFKIASFNILCDKACTTALYGYTPSSALQWSYRRDMILAQLRATEADILCLQEVDSDTMTEFLAKELACDGYKGVYWPKARAKTMSEKDAKLVDGSATFYKHDKYILLEKQVVEMSNIAINRPDMNKAHDIFNRVMPRDNIGVVVFLENRMTGSRLIVANTHLHWDPVYSDVKLVQTAILIEQINKMAERFTKKPACTDKSKRYGIADENAPAATEPPQEPAPSMEYTSNTQVPFVFCGDFNSTADSSVYELLSKGSIKPTHKELTDYSYGNFSKNGIMHPFQLYSAYSALDKTTNQLAFTNCTPGFNDVIDHIWFSKNTLELGSLLGGVDAEYMQTVPGFPNHYFPSDHLLLVAEFAVKGRKEKTTHPAPDFGSSSRRRD
jgi:CCR4-NOT transcription complex subunit 6